MNTITSHSTDALSYHETDSLSDFLQLFVPTGIGEGSVETPTPVRIDASQSRGNSHTFSSTCSSSSTTGAHTQSNYSSPRRDNSKGNGFDDGSSSGSGGGSGSVGLADGCGDIGTNSTSLTNQSDTDTSSSPLSATTTVTSVLSYAFSVEDFLFPPSSSTSSFFAHFDCCTPSRRPLRSGSLSDLLGFGPIDEGEEETDVERPPASVIITSPRTRNNGTICDPTCMSTTSTCTSSTTATAIITASTSATATTAGTSTTSATSSSATERDAGGPHLPSVSKVCMQPPLGPRGTDAVSLTEIPNSESNRDEDRQEDSLSSGESCVENVFEDIGGLEFVEGQENTPEERGEGNVCLDKEVEEIEAEEEEYLEHEDFSPIGDDPLPCPDFDSSEFGEDSDADDVMEENFDIYGFQLKGDKIEQEVATYSHAFKPQSRRHELRWQEYLNVDPALTNRKKLKLLVRKGIPDSLRAQIWSRCLGSQELLESNKGVFLFLCGSDVQPETRQQIEVDLRRTFPSNKMYRKRGGIRKLRRVLHAFAVFKPNIGYCQSLNFIAGMLLLFMEEELAFWCLVRMIDSDSDNQGMKLAGYYESGMVALRRDLCTLNLLLERRLPIVFSTLQKHMVEMEWICSDWFLCLFCTVLPTKTSLRVWDSLILEGHKILFRVALGTFRKFQVAISKLTSLEQIMRFTKSMTRHLVIVVLLI
eukprot:GHVQ01003204.1.p2 GENE.GHVQ01003204.1~~GHVQ01003204.1.p2  ORF type:complete len:701 (-),score=120.59 GHVQ01003204.1:4088-6190(-)